MTEQSLKQILFPKFCILIINYLTNQNLMHNDEHSLSLDESNNFINTHLALINERIQHMIENYDAEGYLEQLYNVEMNQIEDSLYEGDLFENMKNARFH